MCISITWELAIRLTDQFVRQFPSNATELGCRFCDRNDRHSDALDVSVGEVSAIDFGRVFRLLTVLYGITRDWDKPSHLARNPKIFKRFFCHFAEIASPSRRFLGIICLFSMKCVINCKDMDSNKFEPRPFKSSGHSTTHAFHLANIHHQLSLLYSSTPEHDSGKFVRRRL
jgi:hypothetical protein